MSLRNIRKVYGDSSLPPPDGNSDEEYEPLYAKATTPKYQGLVLSSHSESEHESTDAVGMENAAPEAITKKKKKKKKKKQRKVKQLPRSSSKENLEMDEIDKSLMEVNAILGAPAAISVREETPKSDPIMELLGCQHKHLNVANEIKRLFGPEALDPGTRRRGRQSNLNRLLKKAIIVPMADINANFQKVGLSMSVQRRENGYTYFTFDHSREYQRIHRAYLQTASYRTNNVFLPNEDTQRHMHIEGLLEGADSMFRLEEYTAANTMIEQCIAYMQYVAHPSFNLTDVKTRLEYKYLENRAFHVAVLKYLYLLTNRACHRTALELAKLLLNLDPSDPLAILFIIDTLALRAREHQWLINAVDYWCKVRGAGFLFNIQYSYAMAHFHVASNKKDDLGKADKLLQNAMMRFPMVTMKIFECAGLTASPRLQSHPIFKSLSEEMTTQNLKDLMYLYAKFTWSKWREPPVFEWLNRNANILADEYDKRPNLQTRAKELANERLNLFQSWPEELVRHLCVIKPMANLLVDGAVPRMPRSRSADPVPRAQAVNRYHYELVPALPTGFSNSALYELFSSILPHYELERQLIRREAVGLEGLQEGQNNAEIEPGAEAEDDTLTDEDQSDTENEQQGQGAHGGDLVLSVGALTNTVRMIMDIYEAADGPDGNNPADARQSQNEDENQQNED